MLHKSPLRALCANTAPHRHGDPISRPACTYARPPRTQLATVGASRLNVAGIRLCVAEI